MVIHDDTLSRTSNISTIERFKDRSPWRVSDFTLEELQELDFGSWFNLQYEPILTLEKALVFAREKNLFLNVEIKDMSSTFEDQIAVNSIVNMIKKMQTEHLILISSFNHHYLPVCKKLSPLIPTAALQVSKHPSNLIDYLHTLQVNAYHPEDKITNKKTVVCLKEAGFFVNVFTVNQSKRQKKLFEWGVNGIFTDLLS